MAQVIVTESSLQNIGTAIRSKLGTQDTYKPSEMAGAISLIHGDPVLETLTANANNTYTPSSGKDGFSQVVVNVPNSYTSGDEGKVVSNGALVAQSSQSISANGSYDTTLKNQVNVSVPNSYSASDEGKVVDNGALVAQGSQSITQNGTYDTTLKNQVVVNVSGGGGGSKNILGGTTTPTSADGTDGDIYIKYTDYSNLSGYTALEYLGVSTSGAYIDTGVKANEIDKFEIDFECTNTPSNDAGIYGYNASGLEICVSYYNQLYAAIDRGSVGITPVVSRHQVQADAQSLIIDGVTISYTPRWDRAPSANMYAFAFNRNGTPYKAVNTRIYSIKHYYQGSIIQNLLPAKRNSDDVLGLYDLVNDVFYTNSGTGSFIGGEELTSKPIDAAYLKVGGAWIPLEDGDWDDVNTGE